MSKKAIVALTVSLSVTALVIGTVAIGTVVCERIYKRRYFTADQINIV